MSERAALSTIIASLRATACVHGVSLDALCSVCAVNDVKAKVGVIDEQTRRTQEDVREIKETQKDTNKKLDELLRRR